MTAVPTRPRLYDQRDAEPVVVLTGARVSSSSASARDPDDKALPLTDAPTVPPDQLTVPARDGAEGADLELVAVFDAYGIWHRTDNNGDLTISVRVPRSQKYSALPATDHPGTVLQMRVYIDPYALQRYAESLGDIDDWGGE